MFGYKKDASNIKFKKNPNFKIEQENFSIEIFKIFFNYLETIFPISLNF
jgi:hypothetical protein